MKEPTKMNDDRFEQLVDALKSGRVSVELQQDEITWFDWVLDILHAICLAAAAFILCSIAYGIIGAPSSSDRLSCSISLQGGVPEGN